MDKKSVFSYFILAAGIILVMFLTFGASGETRNAYVVNADEPTTGAQGAETASSTDADNGDNVNVPDSNSGTTNPNLDTTGASAPTLSAEEIAALSAEYSDIVTKKNELQTKLNTLLNSQNNFISTLNDLDDLIIEYQDKIDALRESVSQATEMQIKLGSEVESAQQAQDAQYEIVKSHIKDEYENGTYSYLEAFFDATDYSDLINRAEYINAIDAYDERVLQEYIDAKQLLMDKSALITSLASDQQVLQDAYQAEQDGLILISDAKERQISTYQANIDEMQAMVDDLEKQQSEYIAKIEASYTVQYSAGDPNGTTGLTYTGEQFTWPMPSGHTIVSYYGPRVAPTAGATSYHRGIDINCNMGSEVVAAAAGEVIYTGYLGSAGNAVIVDHGSGISTCYFHLSSYACQVGDKVTAGQVICYSGNTGVSTGPHLHFAVRENGEYVNPLKYFKEIEDQSTVANTEGE